MPRKPVDPRTRIAAWREDPTHRHDPVGLAMLHALQARALQHQGPARELLEQRLAARVAEYAGRLPRGRKGAPMPAAARPAPLAALAAELAARAVHTDAASAYPALPAIEEFRTLWATVRSRGQVRQSLAAAPSDGGPLNSAVLVQRAITLMGETCPEYLKHFLAYLDNLSWLDQLQPRSAAPAKDVGRIPKPRRSRTPKG
jgi:hypothetical protein